MNNLNSNGHLPSPAMDGKQFAEVIEIWSSPSDGSSPESFLCYAKIRPTARMNRRKKETVKMDLDCVILEYNPFETASDHAKKLAFEDDDVELTIIAERGQVACRDYPHSRHLCAEFPFARTPHESYCRQCYCYVCDTLAPCNYWKGIKLAHCNASDSDPLWKNQRRLFQSHK